MKSVVRSVGSSIGRALVRGILGSLTAALTGSDQPVVAFLQGVGQLQLERYRRLNRRRRHRP